MKHPASSKVRCKEEPASTSDLEVRVFGSSAEKLACLRGKLGCKRQKKDSVLQAEAEIEHPSLTQGYQI